VWALFLEAKWQGYETDHPPPYSCEAKNKGTRRPLPHTSLQHIIFKTWQFLMFIQIIILWTYLMEMYPICDGRESFIHCLCIVSRLTEKLYDFYCKVDEGNGQIYSWYFPRDSCVVIVRLCTVFRVQADWMCRELLRMSYQQTVWDSPWQTEGHSFCNHLIQWVSQCYAIEFYRSVILLCSVLFCDSMARVRYNLELRDFFYSCYMEKKNSYKSCRWKFFLKFPNTTCPSGDTVSKLVKKVWTNDI
jgi:hypothetical protein